MRLRPVDVLALSWLLLSANGCDRLCGDDELAANVSGSWQLQGEAECDDAPAGFDTDVDVTADVEFEVAQTGGGRTLVLSEPVRRDGVTVNFVGSVEGACVDFTITEKGDDYDIRYVFQGVIDEDRITGSMAGAGDGVCSFEGDFEVDVVVGDRPVPDAGVVTDAGPVDSSTVSPPRECYRDSDCMAGICETGQCVIQCEDSSECMVGEVCSMGRCEDAEGCNCSAGSGAATLPWSLLVFLALAVWRRFRTGV